MRLHYSNSNIDPYDWSSRFNRYNISDTKSYHYMLTHRKRKVISLDLAISLAGIISLYIGWPRLAGRAKSIYEA